MEASIIYLGSESGLSSLFTGKLQWHFVFLDQFVSVLYSALMFWSGKFHLGGCQRHRKISKRLSLHVISGKVFYYFGHGFHAWPGTSFYPISFVLECFLLVFQLLFHTQSFLYFLLEVPTIFWDSFQWWQIYINICEILECQLLCILLAQFGFSISKTNRPVTNQSSLGYWLEQI